MLTRSQSSCIEFRATNISLELDQYLPHEQYASRLVFQIRDFEIIDNVPTSVWRKFMGHMRADGQPRETKSSMLRIEMLNVRPSPGTSPAEEMRLKVQLLPLRFYIDQDALSCLLKFFSFEDDTVPKNPGRSKTEDNTFFQWVQIEPIQVKLDYKPKHVDYSQLKDGKLTEIMNFFHLDGAELMLERVRLHGIKGWVKLVENLVREWLPHIQKTQVPRVISGVSGVRTLVNLGAGIADLFTMPIEQYKKDGRILRGIQKGTRAFAKAATLETIKLTTQLAVGTQVLLEHADDILSSDKDDQASGDGGMGREAVSKYSDQPKDVREGVGLAYRSLSRNLGTAAKTIMSVPTNMYDRGGSQAVIRAVPSAVLKPMIGATEAVSKTLIGLQNTIDPDKRLQMEDKYVACAD
ncbi:ATG C terminal domain-containing protein [Polychytrium aggregatum]|uniref:ATG C terminal domain-containing protein n=1 Tax=Polychytrium aggregatum TaxID=110093 RepID=UPI0022FE8858|nr:ATG C terminal domain-containing protein [Polychytrium aggregatum]KAI9205311.1 ATG C terminal domain-containing protein [Polychytrium aggregatum]